jgi:hypothetical protein
VFAERHLPFLGRVEHFLRPLEFNHLRTAAATAGAAATAARRTTAFGAAPFRAAAFRAASATSFLRRGRTSRRARCRTALATCAALTAFTARASGGWSGLACGRRLTGG